MCGICGIFRRDESPVEQERIQWMRDAMLPRGPDDGGLRLGPGYGLGHRRLAIIDLSPAGHQPMTGEDGAIWIVFNGEIYNFEELAAPLRQAGHDFRSRSDTEALIHGYEEWGLDGLLRRVRGMFAFALVDERRGELHLARDPLGKKPLFFRNGPEGVVFASTAGALLRGLDRAPDVDPAALDDLLWNLCIPGARSIFRAVEKVLPGRAVSFDRGGNRREIVHWRPDFAHPEPDVPAEAWIERVEAAIERAVRRRLISDVPLGVLLSGGVDSSLVTAFAARAAGRVKTFSVATQDAALDESGYAAAVARRYDTEHHVLPVRGDARRSLASLVASMGEPLGDASAVNVHAISRTARESVTVVLTGDGGDEGFGGYSWMRAYHVAERFRRRIPGGCRPLVAGLGGILKRAPAPISRAGTLFRLAGQPLERSFAELGWSAPELRRELFTADFLAALGDHCPREHFIGSLPPPNGATMVDRVMQAHLLTTLPDDYLAKVDYASMAVSLEARSPFLDVDLLELAMRIPARLRMEGGTPKALLRRLARRHLPPETVDRAKLGFVAPVGRWLRSEWSDLVDDLVLGPHIEARGWFRREALEGLVREQRGGVNRDYLIWTLLVLELWMRIAVDGSVRPADAL